MIQFNEAMDYLSTKDRIEIFVDDQLLDGKSTFSLEESEWKFVPNKPWSSGNYTIRADARREDLAGNNLNRLFDRDIEKDPRLEKEYHTISFVIE